MLLGGEETDRRVIGNAIGELAGRGGIGLSHGHIILLLPAGKSEIKQREDKDPSQDDVGNERRHGPSDNNRTDDSNDERNQVENETIKHLLESAAETINPLDQATGEVVGEEAVRVMHQVIESVLLELGHHLRLHRVVNKHSHAKEEPVNPVEQEDGQQNLNQGSGHQCLITSGAKEVEETLVEDRHKDVNNRRRREAEETNKETEPVRFNPSPELLKD